MLSHAHKVRHPWRVLVIQTPLRVSLRDGVLPDPYFLLSLVLLGAFLQGVPQIGKHWVWIWEVVKLLQVDEHPVQTRHVVCTFLLLVALACIMACAVAFKILIRIDIVYKTAIFLSIAVLDRRSLGNSLILVWPLWYFLIVDLYAFKAQAFRTDHPVGSAVIPSRRLWVDLPRLELLLLLLLLVHLLSIVVHEDGVPVGVVEEHVLLDFWLYVLHPSVLRVHWTWLKDVLTSFGEVLGLDLLPDDELLICRVK